MYKYLCHSFYVMYCCSNFVLMNEKKFSLIVTMATKKYTNNNFIFYKYYKINKLILILFIAVYPIWPGLKLIYFSFVLLQTNYNDTFYGLQFLDYGHIFRVNIRNWKHIQLMLKSRCKSYIIKIVKRFKIFFFLEKLRKLRNIILI